MARQVITKHTVYRGRRTNRRGGSRPTHPRPTNRRPKRRNRTKDSLEILLSTIRKMLSELYMTCDLEEKEIFKKHLETLQNITQPNII